MTAQRAIVKKKIREYWPDDVDSVTAVLDRYGESSLTEESRARVQLAVLKLADGSRDALQDYVEMAKQDYRDVIALAEFTREMKSRHLARPNLSPEQHRELEVIRMRDREQYLTWLKNA